MQNLSLYLKELEHKRAEMINDENQAIGIYKSEQLRGLELGVSKAENDYLMNLYEGMSDEEHEAILSSE